LTDQPKDTSATGCFAEAARERVVQPTQPVVPTPGWSYVPLSVVVPCFNETESVRELYQRLTTVCRAEVGDGYEILLIDDGSTDDTWDEIETLVDSDRHVVGVALSRNHGHQLALTAGLTICRGNRILIIDADLQDPPELLPEMMRLMDRGADVVYGQRTTRKGETMFKKASAAIFYRLLNALVDITIPLDTGDFRLMSRRALDILNEMPEKHRFIRGMVSWIGLKQVPLVYERHERFAGETKYPLSRMIRFALDAVTGFSTRPLRIASHLGILFSLAGVVMLFYTFASWATGQTIRGWTSVMTALLLMGGAQLFVLGVFGEYLGRLYVESKRRPLFIIDKIARSSDPAGQPSRECSPTTP